MTSIVQFFSEEVDFRVAHEEAVLNWILDAIHAEEQTAGVINIIFCSDAYLLDLNQRFLDRDTLTDVIAFDYDEEDSVSGDVFISIERIRENAESFDQSFENEVNRVIIHGILHLCGYSDKSPEEKTAMTAKEDYYLSLLPF